MRLLVCLALAGAGALAQKVQEVPAETPPVNESAGRWRLVYQHDENNSELVLNDLRFAGLKFGIAVGLRGDNGRIKPVAVVTRDGGAKWEQIPLKGAGFTVHPLDDRRIYVVTEKGLYYSTDGGTNWAKKKLPEDMQRVWFQDESRGLAVGRGKTIWRTSDGAKTWVKLPEAENLALTSANTSFYWVEFLNDKIGMIVGNSQRPRPVSRVPDWMDPERALRRRQTPGITVVLETRDGGATWRSSLSSIFGQVGRVKLRDRLGVSIFNFSDDFDWPSEVMEIDLASGKNAPLFRRKDRAISDCLILPGGSIVLAGIEPPGALRGAPVPGKVKAVITQDRKKWVEMPVDYRASAGQVFLASPDGETLFLATDTGMILRREKKKQEAPGSR
jgi:hypothetical protein